MRIAVNVFNKDFFLFVVRATVDLEKSCTNKSDWWVLKTLLAAVYK